MEFRILDKNFVDVVLLDRYESLLWVDRYNECGEFELYTPPTDELLEYSQIGNYLYYKNSEHLMIIEHQELNTSFEEGQRIIITGRSVESILDRRILWYKTQFRNNLEDGIRQILDYSIIKPQDPDRKIDNFVFEYSDISGVNNIVVDKEFEIGTDLLTVIQELCKTVNLGFKITLNKSNQFVFKLYKGENRSYSQFSNPWVVFSNRFENLITNTFINDSTEFKNSIRTFADLGDGSNPRDIMVYSNEKKNLLVLDGESYQINNFYRFQFVNGKLKIGSEYTFTSKVEVNNGDVSAIKVELTGDSPYTRIYDSQTLQIQNGRITGTFTITQPDARYDDCLFLTVYSGNENIITLERPIFSLGADLFKITGLDRREYFNDASNVDKTDEMTNEEYESQIMQSAYKALDDRIMKTTINGEVEAKVTYEYNKDYFIGDIVQVESDFGILGTMRVTEFVTSHSNSGLEMYPTFTSTSEGDE